jgi:hypothetical protein
MKQVGVMAMLVTYLGDPSFDSQPAYLCDFPWSPHADVPSIGHDKLTHVYLQSGSSHVIKERLLKRWPG